MTAFQLPRSWPAPAAPERARWLSEQIPTRSRAAAALVECLGGNSPFLSALALREQASLGLLIRHGPDRLVDGALFRLAGFDTRLPRAQLASEMRRAKRQIALASAVADIGGIWDLEQVTAALSRLAEAALGAATRHLLQAAASRGELLLPDPDQPEADSGFIVLGMGKLGARELNYSSDVDLMLLFDPAAQPGHEDLRRVFTRLATDLVSLMQARDADGYVFRTDLRLRPDPSSTPLAVPLPSAIAYYESLGQTWERAAMIKARPVAGDIARGAGFLQTIRPFIWRRNLDFAAIEDIHTMKRRIDHKQGLAPLAGAGAAQSLLGMDLKLGRGGIREIEFLAQSMQLVWGGRAPELRDRTTLGALDRLAQGNYLQAALAADLTESYRLLRRIEHRLQMQDDRQTHSLPATEPGFEAFACFMGLAGGALARSLDGSLRRTREAFENLLADRSGTERGPSIDLDGKSLQAQLAGFGFAQPARAAALLEGWRERHPRALRSERAQALLREMLPALLGALHEQADPMLALTRFDALLNRQSAGVQLLSLLVRNPPLLGRIAFVLSVAPSLAEHLAAAPAALEGLLVPPSGHEAELVLRLVHTQMRQAGDLEGAIRQARTLVRGEEFRLSLAQLDGRLDVDQAGAARSSLADRVITGMLEQALHQHRARHGRVPGGGMAVVALGKAGSRDMMGGSDLDLMLIYDHPDEVAESVVPRRKGHAADPRRRPLPVSQYYIRLAHVLIAALSAPGAEGPLYALDMRLRPSGSKGPVAVSLAAFTRYHAERSWSWERMALCRARVVAGPPRLRRRVQSAIAAAIEQPQVQSQTLLDDARAMRARIAAELPPRGPWDVKLIEGGLLEVEFIAQTLQLVARGSTMRHPTTRIALHRLRRGGLLSAADARMLIDADRFWRVLQSTLRILYGAALSRPLTDATPPALDALLRPMAEFLQQPSEPGPPASPVGLKELEQRMRLEATRVRSGFVRLIGTPRPDDGKK